MNSYWVAQASAKSQ